MADITSLNEAVCHFHLRSLRIIHVGIFCAFRWFYYT